MASSKNSSRSFLSLPLVLIAVIAVLGGALIWYLQRPPSTAAPPPLSPEAKAYVKHLKLSDVELKATESYMKQQVVEILGKIGNQGDRALDVVEINCVFYDPYGQLVLRQRVPIVSRKMGGLKPGETKPFRLPFDNLPPSWNQAMPQLVIAHIQFQ